MPRKTSRRPVIAAIGGLILAGTGTVLPAVADTAPAAPATTSAAQGVPQTMPGAPQPPLLEDSASYVLMDADTGAILAEKNPMMARKPASLTKLMTAYLTYKAIADGMLKPDQIVPVTTEAWKAGGSRMFLDPRAKVTVDQLLHGLIIDSGNDAAITLAQAVGGTQDAFVQRMNAAAQKLGLTGTHYTNVSGLPSDDLHTTALDVAKLSRAIITEYPQFLQVSAQKSYTFDKITQRSWNPVLFKDQTVDGMKTGLTDAAGYCIDATATRGGRRLIAVEMGGSGWDKATASVEGLLNYGYLYFRNAKVVTAGTPVGQLTDPRVDPEQVTVGPAKDVAMTIPENEVKSITPTLTLASPLPQDLPKGTQVGTISYAADGNVLTTVPAVTLTETQPAGLVTRLMRRVKSEL